MESWGYFLPKRFGRNEVSGLHLITVLPNSLDGAADKRREGKVVYLKMKNEK